MAGIAFIWLVALASFTPDTLSADGDAVIGRWRTEPEEHGYAHVEIRREADRYVGEIVWLSEPDAPGPDPRVPSGRPKTDYNNPDP
ncbi:MAG TPA: hypothetical protein VD788_17165, partial [Candidatus Polarisedimenticolaceae bacterium]|nr:hypothetical protein [Candidatus Polarisedimenticolaceae bacterium]